MPMVLAIGSMLVSALFAGATILDNIDDIQQNTPQSSLINLGSGTMLIIGGIAVWYLLKGKK